MFAPVDTPDNTPVATPTPIPVNEERLQLTVPEVVVPDLNGALADITADASTALPPQKRQAKKNSSPTSSKQGKKSIFTKEPSKGADTWQQYTKDEFSNVTLAKAVTEVMQQHKENVLEIATIIDTIFANDIPKELRSTARERVSNILSVGAKKGKWDRGNAGKYSMSKAAFEDNSIG